MTTVAGPPIEKVSPVAAIYTRRLLGFGIWCAIGLAPLLGVIDVPGFTAVIRMYPDDLRRWLIPLAGLFMGMMGLAVEFMWEHRVAPRTLTRWFVRTVIVFVTSLIAMMLLYGLLVTTVDQTVRGADGSPEQVTHAVVTGATAVPAPLRAGCDCTAGEDAAACVGRNLDPNEIRSCFGSKPIALSQFALAIVYLLLTGSFAAAVGLLLLEQRRRDPPPTA